MNTLLLLIPVSLVVGLVALGAFMWALRSGQFDDLDGAANRILFDDDDILPPHAETQGEVAAKNGAPKNRG